MTASGNDREIERRLTSVEIELKHMNVRQDERHADNRAVNAALKDDLGVLDKKMDGILDILSQSKGGWKVMLLVSGAAGTIVAAMIWIAHHLGAPIAKP